MVILVCLYCATLNITLSLLKKFLGLLHGTEGDHEHLVGCLVLAFRKAGSVRQSRRSRHDIASSDSGNLHRVFVVSPEILQIRNFSEA